VIRPTLVVVIVLMAAGSPGYAQQDAASSAGVPVEREPHHHVVFENAAVRVIDARLPAGDTTLYHTHTADNVPVVIRGGSMTVQPLGGSPQPASPRTGDASFARGGYTHQIVNVGPEALQFLDVEVHAPAAVTPPDVAVPAGHEVVLDQPRVRMLRFVASGPPHTHARGVLAVVVPRDHEWKNGTPAGAPAPGAYWWLDGGSAGRTVPNGTEIVEIEVK
jgi:hypothetical protein